MEEDIVLRQETSSDAKAIDLVNESAFGGNDEARLVAAMRGSSSFVPELSLVAESHGRVVGHILLFNVKLELEGGGEQNILALAPLAVMPSQSHRGIGSALVRAAISKAGSLGYGGIVVIGHPDYYRRFGFDEISKWHIRCPIKTSDGAVTALEVISGTFEKGGTLNYPPAFIQLFDVA